MSHQLFRLWCRGPFHPVVQHTISILFADDFTDLPILIVVDYLRGQLGIVEGADSNMAGKFLILPLSDGINKNSVH
jgi:hypothetical protein